MLTVGARLSECMCSTGKDCGHISGAALATPPHGGHRYEGPGAPGTRGHGGGCLRQPALYRHHQMGLCFAWDNVQGYRVFQLAVVQGVMPRSVSAAGSWWPVSVLISRAGGWLGGAGLLRPGHSTQVAARSQPSRAPASSQPAQAALSMQTRNVGHHFVLLQIICWIDH